ncbi:hypothetical protein POM88_042376 [Heracleum sosnowskyi]|uniref:Uncharacterized protein n=1 Tax=Heracleum sosnowskyi TaxID=360622 RepID=A0AAD8HG69_9APIA|nr:hypothetical protein POM88_042376 [Heracleum sosnowskyi]
MFDEMNEKDEVCCSAMVSGACAAVGAFEEEVRVHGYVRENYFEYELELGTTLMDFYAEVWECTSWGREFRDDELVYGIAPSVDHYGCTVDLLARAGQISESGDID